MNSSVVIIPLCIFAVVYLGARNSRIRDMSWYRKLKKPKWTPAGGTIGRIWTILYLLIGLSLLWYWNVLVVGTWHYILAVLLVVAGYLQVKWNKSFFAEQKLGQAYRTIIRLDLVNILIVLLMLFTDFLSAVLMLPYLVWVFIATKLNQEIWEANKK